MDIRHLRDAQTLQILRQVRNRNVNGIDMEPISCRHPDSRGDIRSRHHSGASRLEKYPPFGSK